MQVDSEIDESLYSRQLYVLGKEAMQKMATSNVLIVGLGGLGVEIAKNVVLAGVKSLAIYDPEPAVVADLAGQFYLGQNDIGKPRAAACVRHLSELNSYVPVSVVDGDLAQLIPNYQVVVVTDALIENAVMLNQITRKHNIKFIYANCFGLVGTLFNDFGPEFAVTDTNGEEAVVGTVATIENDGEVYAPDSAMHGLENGMLIELRDAEPAELNGQYRVSVKGPLSFNIGSLKTSYVKGGQWTQVKEPEAVTFASLQDQLTSPEYFLTDFAKLERPAQLHVGTLALHSFKTRHGRLPAPYTAADIAETLQLAKNVRTQYPVTEELDEQLLSTVFSQSQGQVVPMFGVIGGMAAQEVLKAVSGKFMPVRQWMYFDALEALPEGVTAEDAAPRNTRYDGYYAVFGKNFMDKLANLKLFLVGAGAIGCEVLKNWALMGMGSGPDGHIWVTDNDTIEKSNLNRQFLFRPKDVGHAKSEVAPAAAAAINPDLKGKFTCLTEKVGKESEDVFNAEFWNRLDYVTNALDNVEARAYVDRQCIFYQKPLIESGTLGTKGNVQVVVPNLTESYTSSHDPPEKGIPLCTIRSFPAKIDHTIAWAKAQFEELFNESCLNVNQYLTQPNFVESTLKQVANQKQVLEIIYSYLVEERPLTFEQCITWAVDLFNGLFRNDILQLLYNFPPDAKTTTGAPFWAPPKRQPTAAVLDINNATHLEFLTAAANLRAFNYGLKGESDPAVFANVVGNYHSKEFNPSSGIKIAVTDDEISNDSSLESNELAKIADKLPAPSSLAGFRLLPAEFEKDDDTNFHIDFINAASNLRATNYGIDAVERSKTKFIAGRIIPAIATTTALVTGLATIEALKVVQRRKIEDYKNGFVSLALPFFGFSEPIASTKLKYNDREIDRIWGRLSLDGDVTLQEFLDYFEKEHGLDISMVACENLLLYASFQPPAKLKERLPLNLSKLVESISKKPIENKQLVFEICAEDREGNDIEDLPFVVVTL